MTAVSTSYNTSFNITTDYNYSTYLATVSTANISISGFYKRNQSEVKEAQRSFFLDQNYPNPFNPTTEIRYSLPEPSHVKIVVRNTLGQEVKTLLDAQQSEGEHSVKFNASALPSGVYFYTIHAGGFTKIKKMIYLR